MRIEPADDSQITYTIEYNHPLIRTQTYTFDWSVSAFEREIAEARTFGFLHEVEMLWAKGLAKGGTLENTVVLTEQGIMNESGLRFQDEFVRHKLLDAVGDLALAGLPMLGAYRSYCGGHRLNFAVLEELFASRANYAVVEGGARREGGYAEIGNGIAVPAFAPDTH